MEPLVVGQTLYIKGMERWTRGRDYETTVVKIGRKWATLADGNRINPRTLAIDGKGYMPGHRVYLSREQSEADEMLRTAWADFCRDFRMMSYTRLPEGMTVERLAAARVLLGLKP